MDRELELEFKKYLVDEGDLSWNTIRQYYELIKQLPDTIYPDNPTLIKEINLFLALKKKNSDKDLRGHYYAVKKLLSSWERKELLYLLVNVKKSKRRKFGHYVDDLQLLEKMCSSIKNIHFQMAAFVQLYTGMRAQEVLSLRSKNITIDADGGLILQNIGKGGKTITTYIPAKLVERTGIDAFLETYKIIEYPFIKKKTADSFQNFRTQYIYYFKAVKEAAKRVGIESFSTHDFRRNFITRLFQKGYDIEIVRQLAHHTNINNTLRYKKESPVDFKKITEELY